MKLNRKLSLLAFVPMFVAALSGCESSNDASTTVPIVAQEGVFVFNAGNQASAIEGSLSFVDAKQQVAINDVFKNTNGRSLGATVQDGVVLNDLLYIAVYESNTIEVVNKNTLVSLAQIRPDASVHGSSPRDIVTDGSYVYVSMYTGHVVRINPATAAIDKTVKVGPNPEEMAIVNNYLYVVNSDGMNYGAEYANGKSVSKINLSTFVQDKKIDVGMNPTRIAADASGNVLVLCMGNYGSVPAAVWKINRQDEAQNMNIVATLMAVDGHSLYAINAPWGATGSTVQYPVYNTLTGERQQENFVAPTIDAPAALAIDPASKRIFISSYNMVGGFASPGTPCYLNEYTAQGTFVKRYEVGVGAAAMTFLKQ